MTNDVDAIPARFGRYEVLGVIGRGAFADVVRAWDDDLASHVAIKVLKSDSSMDELVRQRFVAEGQLLRRVHNSAVVAVHDIGELDDGRPYLVVDLATGGTIADRLEHIGRHPVEARTIKRVVEALAAGLGAMHSVGVVHRDIKPENLLIGSLTDAGPVEAAEQGGVGTVIGSGLLADAEWVLIGDLGLAKDLTARGGTPSVIGGSARYQAPEQLRPDGEVGPPTDLYAASAVLWRLLTGDVAPEPHDISDELARFRPGWQAFFTQAMAIDPTRRFGAATAWRAAAIDHLDLEPVALSAISPDSSYLRASPYKGLAAFQPEDASVFFGREDLVDELLRRLQVNRVLIVAGPSGSGKSSLVRAGLLPALHDGALPGSETWRYDFFTPGPRPFDELHYRLTNARDDRAAVGDISPQQLRNKPQLARNLLDSGEPSPPRLLYIDQFEELFTQSHDPAVPAAFVEALSAIADPADSRLRLVLAVRADFYGRCAQIAWLARRISDNQVLVGPMSTDNMRRAIEEPARRSGLRVEPGLVDLVLDQAGRSAGSLPLISHALMETWARRDGSVLTIDGFRATGGVAGALAQSADALFDDVLDDEQRAAARRLLLRLVTPGDGTADTRRRLPRSELRRDAQVKVMDAVVDDFVTARLLSVDDETVEIAHEALISGWPRLSDWIDTERENLRFRARIGRAAHEWEVSDRDPDLLYRGTPLATAVEWAAAHGDDLNAQEQEFVAASEDARLRSEQLDAHATARAARNRHRATAALAVLAIASVVATIVAFVALQRSRSNADAAEQQFAVALGTSAAGQARSDPIHAILLAIESMERSRMPTVEARSALIEARLAMAEPGVIPAGASVSTPGSFKMALRPDGALAAVADQTGPIRLYDTLTGKQVGDDLERHTVGPRSLAFSSDGETLVSVSADGLILAWDLLDPATVDEPTVIDVSDSTVWAVSIHPDDSTIVVGRDDGTLEVFDLVTGEAALVIEWSDGAGIISAAFSPDGSHIIASNRAGRLQRFDATTGEATWPADATGDGPNLWEIVFNPDGTLFATAGDRDTAQIHRVEDGSLVPGAVLGEPSSENAVITKIHGVAFSGDGRRLIGGSASGAVHTWDLDDLTKPPTSTLSRHGDAVEHGQISADGSIYVTVGDDKRLRSWRVGSTPVSHTFEGFAQGAYGVAFSPDGGRLAIGDGEGGVSFVDSAAGSTNARAPQTAHDGAVFDIAWSADGSLLATIGDDGVVHLWDGRTETPTEPLGRHVGRGRSVTFAPDGNTLVSSDRGDEQGQGAEVIVWDVETGIATHRLAGHRQGVRATSFSEDGSMLATADGRGEIRLWEADGFELIRQWTATDQINPVWALAFSSGGRLASVDSSEDLRVWDPETGAQVGETVSGLGTNGATGVGFSAAGDTVVVLTQLGELHLFDWSESVTLSSSPITAHDDSSFRLRFAPDGVRFATTSTDGTVRIWNLLSIDAACTAVASSLDVETDDELVEGPAAVRCR